MIDQNDINKFSMELFLKPNIVCSIIGASHFVYYPLLYFVCICGNFKTFNLFFDTLLHYGECILSQKLSKNEQENEKLFLKRYLNWSKLSAQRMAYETGFVKFYIII